MIMKEMTEKMSEYERLARHVAKQVGQDPDRLVAVGTPQFVHAPGGLYHYVDVGQLRPLWTLYMDVARAALGVELR